MNIIKRFINRLYQYIDNPLQFSRTVENNQLKFWVVKPLFKNDEAILYCHGGFESISKPPEYGDVNYWVKHGYTVYVLRFDDEFGSKRDIESDIKDVHSLARDIIWMFKNGRIHLLGVSRGGFVALQSFIESLFYSCIAVAAPSSKSWTNSTVAKKLDSKGKLEYFVKLPFPTERVEELNKTNLLLIAGATDPVVPLNGILELWNKIDKKIKTKSISVMPNESHGVMNSTKARQVVIDFLNKIKE